MADPGCRLSTSKSGEKVNICISGMSAVDVSSADGLGAQAHLISSVLLVVAKNLSNLTTNSDNSQSTLITENIDVTFLHSEVASRAYFKENSKRNSVSGQKRKSEEGS